MQPTQTRDQIKRFHQQIEERERERRKMCNCHFRTSIPTWICTRWKWRPSKTWRKRRSCRPRGVGETTLSPLRNNEEQSGSTNQRRDNRLRETSPSARPRTVTRHNRVPPNDSIAVFESLDRDHEELREKLLSRGSRKQGRQSTTTPGKRLHGIPRADSQPRRGVPAIEANVFVGDRAHTCTWTTGRKINTPDRPTDRPTHRRWRRDAQTRRDAASPSSFVSIHPLLHGSLNIDVAGAIGINDQLVGRLGTRCRQVKKQRRVCPRGYRVEAIY